jgi:hypothetical protein
MKMPVIREMHSLEDVHTFLRARADLLGISRSKLDELAHIADGYASKVLSRQPVRSMGIGIAIAIADALGMSVVLVESPEKMERIANVIGTRDPRRLQRSYRNHAARANEARP